MTGNKTLSNNRYTRYTVLVLVAVAVIIYLAFITLGIMNR